MSRTMFHWRACWRHVACTILEHIICLTQCLIGECSADLLHVSFWNIYHFATIFWACLLVQYALYNKDFPWPNTLHFWPPLIFRTLLEDVKCSYSKHTRCPGHQNICSTCMIHTKIILKFYMYCKCSWCPGHLVCLE